MALQGLPIPSLTSKTRACVPAAFNHQSRSHRVSIQPEVLNPSKFPVSREHCVAKFTSPCHQNKVVCRALEPRCLLMAFLRVITEGSAVPRKPVFSG